MFERCIGFAWCSSCRIYSGNMVYVHRKRVLVDALASLPSERRERLLRSETKLIDFLDRQAAATSAARANSDEEDTPILGDPATLRWPAS
jgi:hypothetical protein